MLRLRERLTSSEDNCTILRRQLEHQRRLAEDANRFRSEITELRRELEAEREMTLNLQGRNTRLEATNLELSLKIESLQNEVQDSQVS
jgi:methylphosphotriester-DNA--protein-cysteine methyltransferase